ncbi:MAG: PaaI family thioesterase [Alphaproteobacteria bacterium]|nr:PaaI family thioesterase [Alphaproteobacteria bacterium]
MTLQIPAAAATRPLSREDLASGTGLEVLQRMIDGQLPAPPASAHLQFVLTEASQGRAVFAGMPNLNMYNPLGVVHGGWAATILDSAMACAVMSGLAAGPAYATVEFKVNLVRAIRADSGPVRCEATLLSLGSRVGTAEG